jgi:hypothetical protein
VSDQTPTDEELSQQRFATYLNDKADEFRELVRDKMAVGQEKYGTFTWLENDTVDMALQELADLTNYTLFTAVKLLMLRDMVAGEYPGQSQDLSTGFIPTNEDRDK